MWEASFGPVVNAIRNAGPQLYTAALVASSLVLFLPDSVIAQIGLTGARETYRLPLGLVFVASASLVAVHTLFSIPGLLTSPWRNWRYRSHVREHLSRLTAQEKQFLRPYIANGEATRHASVTDGIANGLQAKGIVYRAANITLPGQPGLLLPYNLQPIARKILERKCWLLDHPSVPPAKLRRLSNWVVRMRQRIKT